LPPRFAAAAKTYEALRALLEAGRLTRDGYLAELQKLIFQDATGNSWMLGAESGQWYWHEGNQWVRRDPPDVEPRVPAPSPPASKPPAPKGRSGTLSLLWGAAAFLVVLLTGVFSAGSMLAARLAGFASGSEAPSEMASVARPPRLPTSTAFPTSVPVSPTPRASPTPEWPFTIRPFDPNRDESAEGILGKVDWEYQNLPGTYEYDINFAVEWSPLLGLAWCAADETTLEDNWNHIQMSVTLDGHVLDEAQFLLEDQLTDGMACRGYKAVIEGWQLGVHTLSWKQSFDEALNDGQSTFPAGDYVTVIRIQVQEGMIFEEEFVDSSGGWSEEVDDKHSMSIEDGQYHILMRQGPSYSLSLYHGRTFAEAFVSTTARVVGSGAFGIVLGFTDADNFLVVELSESGECRVKERAGGRWETLQEWGPVEEFEQDQPNRLTAFYEDGEIRVLLNSYRVGGVSVDSTREGKAGLAVGSEEAVQNLEGHFERFYIEALK
jgi:hypothetical protein